jgi:hypothetical protein
MKNRWLSGSAIRILFARGIYEVNEIESMVYYVVIIANGM